MSQPTIPMISPEIMRDVAYNLLLASIAMEEIGLNNIADGDGDIDELISSILKFNDNSRDSDVRLHLIKKIFCSLVDSINLNHTLTKRRLEKILSALKYNIKRQTTKISETAKAGAESQAVTAKTKNTQNTPDIPVVTSPKQVTMSLKNKDEPVFAEHTDKISDT